jgi:deoxyribonuclease V
MPYVPGLLSFRESPIALPAFEKLQTIPDLVMVDGAGIAHPRGLGIASHLGLLLDVPTIGVAKSFLYGVYDRSQPGPEPPSSTPLRDRAGHEIGSVLRTKRNTNPLYISPGHRVSVASAMRLVIECLRSHKLPEPTRNAHNLITAYKKTLGT